MSQRDLTDLLRQWRHEAGRINARRFAGDDGREKIQVRIPLGVLQMELDGRPDGDRPEGCESLLDYQTERLEHHRRASGSAAGFVLTPEECRALREEAVQYYHRYVALFALADYANVVRDANRNLRVVELCRRHAATEQDRAILEQFFRPHVIMMRVRAEAENALAERDLRRALAAIDGGLDEIRVALEATGRAGEYDQSNEVQLLRGMRDALIPKLPASQRVELQERLRAAIDSENYELAAILRDELRLLE